MPDNTILPDSGASNPPRLRSDEISATPGINILGVKIRLGDNGFDGNPVKVGNGLPIITNGDIATSLVTGQKLVPIGTAQRLSPSSVAATRMIAVQAFDSNTGNVFLGVSDVTTSNGWPIGPGQAITIASSDVTKLFVISETGGQRVSWMAL
jgi:hypothetical protein